MSAVEPRRLRIERRRTSTSRHNPSPSFATLAVVDAEVQRRLSWHRCSKKGAERDQCDVECGGATRVALVVLASQRRRAKGRSGPQGPPPACRRPVLEVRPGPRGRSVASGPAARKYAARARNQPAIGSVNTARRFAASRGACARCKPPRSPWPLSPASSGKDCSRLVFETFERILKNQNRTCADALCKNSTSHVHDSGSSAARGSGSLAIFAGSSPATFACSVLAACPPCSNVL